MATISGIAGSVIDEASVTINGTGLDVVTEVNLHSPSGETVVEQTVTNQTESSLDVAVEQGSLPYGDLAVELIDGDTNPTEPVVMEAQSGITVVDVATVSTDPVVTDALVGIDLEVGDQVVITDGNGSVDSDGCVSGAVEVSIWDETTETYTDPEWVTGNGGDILAGKISGIDASIPQDFSVGISRTISTENAS